MRHLVSTAALAALLLSACSPDGGRELPGSVQEVASRGALSATVHGDAVWTATTSMGTNRSDHSATVLGSGQVLVAGGDASGGDASAKIFDPIHRTWTATGSLHTGRSRHGAVLLGSGKVLVVGGFGVAGVLSSAELYDPATRTWTATGSLSAARYLFTTVLLDDGKVLVAGGMSTTPQTPMSSAELYDPDTGTWSPTGSLATARYNHTATLLQSGSVLVSGGANSAYQTSSELYDPTTGAWNPTGSLLTARSQHVAALLPSGKVLVAGGWSTSNVKLSSAELFDPANGTWSATAPMAAARYSHTATPLSSGKVLVAGGYGTDYLASTELYDPTSETWSSAGSLTTARSRHVATLLPFDRVLVTGGWSSSLSPNTDLYAPSNTAPVVLAQGVTTTEDTSLDVVLTATDAEGDAVEYTIETPPTHGTLSGIGGNLTYTPAANFGGTDSFSFAANDGRDESLPAVVTITVTPVNDPPVAQARSATTAEDTATDVTLTATDVEGDLLSLSIVAQPAHGTVTLVGQTATYTPAANYAGADTFTFKANDGAADSNVAAVALTVTPVNDAPVAQASSSATAEDTAVDVTLAATDVDGDALTYAIVAQPTHGTVTLAGATATYTPAADFAGTDTFTFKARDGVADSNVATVTITVSPVNDVPVATDGTASLSEDGSVVIGLAATDVDGDALTYTIVSPAAHGLLAGFGGGSSWTYAPAADFNGSDSFTFKANDGTADSNVATVTITVTPVNDPPIAMPVTASVVENSSVAITLGGLDVDANALAYALVTQPSHGTVTLVGPTATYTPAASFVGTDTFTYKANDGLADSPAATVTVAVVNDPANDPKSGGGCSSATTGSVSPLGALLLGLLALRRRPRAD